MLRSQNRLFRRGDKNTQSLLMDTAYFCRDLLVRAEAKKMDNLFQKPEPWEVKYLGGTALERSVSNDQIAIIRSNKTRNLIPLSRPAALANVKSVGLLR